MSSLRCPLCSVALESSSLEGHLRQELRYPAIACGLCPLRFTSLRSARAHFAGPLAEHPGAKVELFQLEEEEGKQAKLLELLRLARAEEEAEKRLCVCGRCRLLCREPEAQSELIQSSVSRSSLQAASPFSKLDAEAFFFGLGGRQFVRTEAQKRGGSETVVKEPETIDCSLPAEVGDSEAAMTDENDDNPVAEADENEIFEQDENELNAHDTHPDERVSTPRSEYQEEEVDGETAEGRTLAEFPSDGKVGCMLCGRRLTKDHYKEHALGCHLPSDAYRCGLCPYANRRRALLAKHLQSKHSAQLTSDTATVTVSKHHIAQLIQSCFGSTEGVLAYARMRCRSCDKLFNKHNLSQHVATVHLAKVQYRCRLCEYTSKSSRLQPTKTHVRAWHGAEVGEATVDSRDAQRLAPLLKDMVRDLFY